MGDFGNEWAKELYDEKKAYLEELNKNPIDDFLKKIEDDEIEEMGLIGDDVKIYKILNNFNIGDNIRNKLVDNLNNSINDEYNTIKRNIIKNSKKYEKYKEGKILKCKSELKLNSNNKYEVETKINIENNIDDKIKRALIKSIIKELNKKFDDYIFCNSIHEIGKELLSKQLFESMKNAYKYDINPTFTTYQGLNFKPKKHTVYKEENIFKCKSELKLNSKNKYEVETTMNINNDVNDKIKRALINSVIKGLNQNNELNKNLFDCFFFMREK